MTKRLFWLILISITFLGLLLRVNHYTESPPQDEAFDEVHYAWGGVTWLTQGTPKSWSWFNSYTHQMTISRFGVDWRIVWPVIEKPPLYFLISGLWMLAGGIREPFSVNYAVMRLLPICLTTISIFLLGLLGKKLVSSEVGLISAFLFATTPTIVLANRMSVTENTLIPLILLGLNWFPLEKTGNIKLFPLVKLGIITILAFLIKQAGIAFGIVFGSLFLVQKEKKAFITILFCVVAAITLYLIFGAYYDWHLFLALQKDVSLAHPFAGLPQVVENIFRFPTISDRDRGFTDGTMLLGYLLLFTSPLWLDKLITDKIKRLLLLTFPFTYLLLISLGESGSAHYTFWGWYLYPLFPFLSLILAIFFNSLWKNTDFFQTLLAILTIGASSIYFAFLTLPPMIQHRWQYIFLALVVTFGLNWLTGKKNYRRLFLSFVFVVFALINILTILHFAIIYPPLST